MDIKEEILAQMDSSLRPEFDKAINNAIEVEFKEDVKTLGVMVANIIKYQWEVMKPHLFYAYCLGVKAQEAKAKSVPEWINVKDRLPEKNTRVLLFDNGGFGVMTGRLGSAGWYLEGDLDKYANITHWMPLPDAPQEPAND